ncbi:hypothetical protein BC828DRAFT_155331 [Blastocladiella britannica]|nr:hypothetical protein BC828DRAFT_155331 [Blastocladiella britannica]
MMLCSDFLQLLPVGSATLFGAGGLPRQPYSLASDRLADDKRGLALYQSFKKCVRLTRNMRFVSNLAWGQALTRGQEGVWNASDFDAASTSALLASGEDAFVDMVLKNHPMVISPDNNTRCAFNQAFMDLVLSCEPLLDVLVCPAVVKVSAITLAHKDVVSLHDVADSLTGGAPIVQRFFVGMRVRITKNQCMQLGVVNGALGSVYHVDVDGGTRKVEGTERMHLPRGHVRNVYVMLDHPVSNVPYAGLGLPVGVVPVAPVTCSFQLRVDKNHKVDCTDLAKRVLKASTTVATGYAKANMVQFPLVPAYAMTGYGVQGMTLDAIAVSNPVATPGAAASAMTISGAAMYVIASRLRNRLGLWFITDPSAIDWDVCMPSEPALKEDKCLSNLSVATLDRHFPVTKFLPAPVVDRPPRPAARPSSSRSAFFSFLNYYYFSLSIMTRYIIFPV